jgi:peptidoglycan/xylan/chitin deacetylase (PgdA/CDA1 family)
MQAGHAIGAHSIDHPNYSTIVPQVQFLQTRDSMRAVAEKFNLTNKYFAFPFTADGVVKELFPAMYNELQIGLSFGTAGIRKSEYPQHIERIPAELEHYSLPEIIRNEYAYHLLKKRFGK